MSDSSSARERWPACEPGELVGFGKRAQALRRRRALLKTGSATAVFLGLVAAGGWLAGLWTDAAELTVGGISCRQVQQMMDAYAAGTLSPEDARHMREHLAGCSHCRKVFEERKPRTELRNERRRPVADGSANDRGDSFALVTRN